MRCSDSFCRGTSPRLEHTTDVETSGPPPDLPAGTMTVQIVDKRISQYDIWETGDGYTANPTGSVISGDGIVGGTQPVTFPQSYAGLSVRGTKSASRDAEMDQNFLAGILAGLCGSAMIAAIQAMRRTEG